MRKNGPKIKELAQELGITARSLIDRCRSEGVFAQNSLTHIEPALVPKIKAWFAPDAEAKTEAGVHKSEHIPRQDRPI